MGRGRSVRVFLVDGSADGLWTAELGNWTGKALFGPRTDLHRIKERPEVHRTGLYLLLADDPTASSGIRVYVGEGDEIWTRLAKHEKEKDFWTHVVCFVSKDQNLTKTHARWLEGRLVEAFRKEAGVAVENSTQPSGGSRLPEADLADMQTFLENVLLVLPILGWNLIGTTAIAAPTVGHPDVGAESELILTMTYKKAQATCVVRSGHFVVQAGSRARTQTQTSISAGYGKLRTQLVEEGILTAVVGKPGLLEFSDHYSFRSPSGAASVVSGASVNGRKTWLTQDGVPYGDWQSKQVDEDFS